MKKVLFVLAISTFALGAKTFAQEEGSFKPFKVDLSVGYAIPAGGTGSKGGALFAIEPKYAVMPQLSLGLRLEIAATVSGTNLTNVDANTTASVKAAASYLATGDFYFNNNDFRPFLGAGAGLYQTAGAEVTQTTTDVTVASSTKFGGMVRGGFEYKHFRLGLEYNFIGKTIVPPTSGTSNNGYEIKNGYAGIKMGFCIGGGRL
ncbi:MAG: hypothetical protein JWR61_5687 [Ferruginibacter sp.]|jgi:outer membrane protein W|uniref:outer membrane protein n=1 Tax=Ferruginibacter sp. TaxID=1940288 RepID=UPI002658DA0C|nr:outer membrane beta-barrel protein [Ferruginibacter sp.]MDB5280732.1 hypothetical protein [Ferruginibacter sp.]